MARKKKINLALQGGGAHGSFTWGVLDRLLEEPEIEIAAISGTSAGALNAGAVKCGLASGKPEYARERLEWLWGEVGALNDERLDNWFRPVSLSWISKSIELSPMYAAADMATRVMSPYSWGGLYRNPLERIVSQLNFDNVCGVKGPALFICATNVRTGKIRLFTGDDITVDAIMASACLPTMFQAVEIRDPKTRRVEAYWDGGYTGNPALYPLFEAEYPDDIIIVNINPLVREEIPHTPQQIQNRINEISFNTSLLRELRAIAFVRRLIGEGKISTETMKDVKVHMIADDDLMTELSVATKIVAQPIVLSKLKAAGRAAADEFLRKDADKIGEKSTVNLREMFD